jgi:hypothetical protein
MLVESASLCWLAGRLSAARDGAAWAEQFHRWPALRAVIRDASTGLGKAVELVRARRREQGQADLEDGLDVFHTLREGGRALRATWAEAGRALWSEPRRRNGTSISGAGKVDPTAVMVRR